MAHHPTTSIWAQAGTILIRASVLSALLVLLAPVMALAQPESRPRQLLFEEPFEIPSLGLRVFLPEESLVDLSRLQGGKTNVKVVPQDDPRDWVIQVWNFLAKDVDLSLEQAMENLVQEKLRSRIGQFQNGDIRSMFRMFDRSRELLIGAEPAQRVYFDVPGDDRAYATGYTIFRLAPGNFVIFQLDCAQAAFTRNRVMFELLVASAEFRDAEELSESRAVALLAGEAILGRFSNEDFTTVMTGKPQFFRMFRPAETGDPKDAKEVGYQRITLRRGKAGEVSGKPESRWRPADRDVGFIVVVEARTLLDDAIADSIATFYLSDDRETELWSNRMEVRRGEQNELWTETGIRTGNSMIVRTVQDGSDPKSLSWDDLPTSYISRVESYLLPRLIVRNELAGEYGYYAFDSYLGKLSIRRDTFERKAPNAWSLITQASENSPPAGALMNDEGEIVQRDLPRGEIVKPIDGRELMRLWKQKNLPVN